MTACYVWRSNACKAFTVYGGSKDINWITNLKHIANRRAVLRFHSYITTSIIREG